MSRAAVVSWVALALAGCPSKADSPAPPPRASPPRDAGSTGVTTINGYDPASGMHLDDDGTARVDPARMPPARSRTGRPIDILLKSSPTGAMAAVDGVQIGPTPTYWTGDDGREHEFTFVLRNHAVARYRFVPITSGTVHARLEPIAEDVTDGGIGPVIAPTFAPDAPAPPPLDAAPRAVTPDALPPNDALPMPPEESRPSAGPQP